MTDKEKLIWIKGFLEGKNGKTIFADEQMHILNMIEEVNTQRPITPFTHPTPWYQPAIYWWQEPTITCNTIPDESNR